ncbi:MAG: hypothetical protein JWO79_5091 [Actinomycetia bacterium]|nr:hypothetical protein [Actinomycetes bacterium]MDQ1651010.1 hypothetical protein [Cryptosporangiaceae bacterium]MDQ1655147.1 hypothetical protein [Cryptosporangiaceae bacterium]
MTVNGDLDLSNYGTGMGPEYEWLISDHPLALAERQRRAAEFFAAELDEPAALDEPDHQPAPEEDFTGMRPGLGEEVGGLATHVEPTADRDQLRYATEAEPDEVTVAKSRADYEQFRRDHGEPTYTYPAHYLGASAVDYPAPGL